MKQQTFLELTQKYIESTLTQGESDLLYNALRNDHSLKQEFSRVTAEHGILKKCITMDRQAADGFTDGVMTRLHKQTGDSTPFSREVIERIQRRKRRSRRNRFAFLTGIAAMAVIGAGIFLYAVRTASMGTLHARGKTAYILRNNLFGTSKISAGDSCGIRPGDTVYTEKGPVYIDLDCESRIDLKNGTKLICSTGSEYRLEQGAVYCEIVQQAKGSKFTVSDPYGHTAAVKGTRFEMELLPDNTVLKVEQGTVAFAGTEIRTLEKCTAQYRKNVAAVSDVFLHEIAVWKFGHLLEKGGILFKDTCDSISKDTWEAVRGSLNIAEGKGIDGSKCFVLEPDSNFNRYLRFKPVYPFRFQKIVFDLKYRMPPYDGQGAGMITRGGADRNYNNFALVKKEDLGSYVSDPPHPHLYTATVKNHPEKWSKERFYFDLEQGLLFYTVFTSDRKLASWYLYADKRPVCSITYTFTGSPGKLYIDDITCYSPDKTFNPFKW